MTVPDFEQKITYIIDGIFEFGRYVFHRQFFVDEKKVIKLSMKKNNHEYFFHRQFFSVHRQILNFIDKYIFFSSTIF